MSPATIVVESGAPTTTRARRNTFGAASVSCPACNKPFSRKDVLTRHIKMKHQDPSNAKPRKRSKRTSCLRCAFFKMKCFGRPTCQQCDKSNLVCQFDFSTKPDNRSQPVVENTTEEDTDQRASISDTMEGNVSDQVGTPPEVIHRHPWRVEGKETDRAFQEDSISHHEGLDITDLHTYCISQDNRDSAVRSSGTSPSEIIMDAQEASIHIIGSIHSRNTTASAGQELGGQLEFDMLDYTSTNTILGYEENMFTMQDGGGGYDLPGLWNSEHSPILLQRAMDTDSRTNHTSTKSINGESENITSTLAPSTHGKDGGKQQSTGQFLISTDVEMQQSPDFGRRNWPWQDLSDPDAEGNPHDETIAIPFVSKEIVGSRKVPLSNNTISSIQLRDGDETPSFLGLHTHRTTVSDILKAIEIPINHHHMQEVPEISDNDAVMFWDAYFDHFHETFPVLHKGSMEYGTCLPLLLSAITAIGASYVKSSLAEDYSVRVLGRLCALLSRTYTKPQMPIKKPMSELLIRCLTYYHIVLSGSETFFDYVIAAQVHMMPEARNMSLFSLPEETFDVPPRDLPLDRSYSTNKPLSVKELLEDEEDDSQLALQWQAWSRQEQQKRLAWGVTALHYRCCLMFHTTSTMKEEELNIYLPCYEALWQADTVSLWRAQFPYTDRPPRNVPFLGILHRLVSNKKMLEELPILSRLVVLTILKLKER